MKAAVYKNYGPPEVVKVVEVEKPTPKDNEILVKVEATTVTSGDARLRSSDFPPLFWLPGRIMFGLFKPKKNILGHEFAGIVEKVGKNITKFKIGDKVFGTTTLLKSGSHAEYVCLPEKWKSGVVELMPSNLSYAEAAALPIGGMTALFLLNKANYQNAKSILIYGASGSVGSYAIQLSKIAGAKVTAVCSSKNIEIVKSLGADEALDYKLEDYSNLNEKYDIVFDAVGFTDKNIANKILNKDGRFVSVTMMTSEKTENLLKIKSLAEEHKIKAYIDRKYKLDEIVDAYNYVDSGRKVGNIIIEI